MNRAVPVPVPMALSWPSAVVLFVFGFVAGGALAVVL